MAVAAGDKLLVTRNDAKKDLLNGQIHTVKEIKNDTLILSNGTTLDTRKPIHARQGYTLTSKSAQAYDSHVTVAFMPAEAATAMSAEQMLVTISRPKNDLIVTTNSVDVVRAHTIESAVQIQRPNSWRNTVRIHKLLNGRRKSTSSSSVWELKARLPLPDIRSFRRRKQCLISHAFLTSTNIQRSIGIGSTHQSGRGQGSGSDLPL
jgi:hypothetical protein